MQGRQVREGKLDRLPSFWSVLQGEFQIEPVNIRRLKGSHVFKSQETAIRRPVGVQVNAQALAQVAQIPVFDSHQHQVEGAATVGGGGQPLAIRRPAYIRQVQPGMAELAQVGAIRVDQPDFIEVGALGKKGQASAVRRPAGRPIPGLGLAGQKAGGPVGPVDQANFAAVQVIQWGVDVSNLLAIRRRLRLGVVACPTAQGSGPACLAIGQEQVGGRAGVRC